MARSLAGRWGELSALTFFATFAVYAAAAVLLLMIGLVPTLALLPRVGDALVALRDTAAVGSLAELMLDARSHAETPGILALDYALSILNIAVGLFLVVRRPREWITRLLAIGMVGTAVAFNLQTHALFIAEIGPLGAPGARALADLPFNLVHIAFHAISGAAYAHAFLLLPNGALIPRWLRWPVAVVYFLLIEEVAIPIAGLGLASAARPGIIFGLFDDAFGVRLDHLSFRPAGIVDAEITFFVLFFGLLIPSAGLYSAFSRYRLLDARERAQTRLIVMTLVFAFAVGFAFILLSVVSAATRGSVVAEDLRKLTLRIFPPLYAVIPPALLAAIVRYHLYDIDVLINRTVVYGSVTAVLATGFAVLSVAAHRVVEQLTGERSDIVPIVIALALIFGFAPLRKRIQPIVDRLLPGRGELTLLFTDIVGSTQRAVALGDHRWRQVLTAYRSTVRRELARSGGREVDTAGDGFFATFERPMPAVRCAVALRGSLRDLGLDSRIGLHMGECELRGERVSGVNVIIAARVMGLAGANEIVMSTAVSDLVVDPAFRLRDRGIGTLKGVPGEWPLRSLEIGAPSRSD